MRFVDPIWGYIVVRAGRATCRQVGFTAFLAGMLLLLAGCAVIPTTPDPVATSQLATPVPQPARTISPQATPEASSWEPPVPPSHTPGPRQPVITFQVSGGITGRATVFHFWDTGEIDKNDGQPSVRVASGDYYHLMSLITAADFFNLKDKYDSGNVSDDIYDTITVNRNGHTRTVSVAELGGRNLAPLSLLDLIADIRRLAELTELPVPPTIDAASDKTTLTFEVAGLNEGSVLQIDGDGLVSLYEYDHLVGTERLTDERLCEIASLVEAARFFDLEDRYIYQNPPGVTSEVDYLTVTCTQGGRSHAVTTRGTSESPRALVELEKTLQDVKQEVRVEGTPSAEPEEMILYMYMGQDRGAYMTIDTEGGVHYSSKEPTAGHLSAAELKSLRQMLENSGTFDQDHTFSPPDSSGDATKRQRVIVSYTRDGKAATVDAFSGAHVSGDFDAIVRKLNEIYGRFLTR